MNPIISLSRRSALRTARNSFSRPLSTTTPLSAVKADQTKKSNDPSASQKEEHGSQAEQVSGEGRDHPAKQPDPQQSPSKSTGVREEGPNGKAGSAPDQGVHTEKDAGAGDRSGGIVNKPQQLPEDDH
ncbi:Uu.00g059920.m01.CDS01 [Anthostomella pinea]|uniref:Uu.00g059920.m01.CDS01 n=1 Tax=Anthostomella pinea TaxID=933095 RepID=A0AAI8VTC1_9PEZI|nr:Uu.00g059920.m01.CDS01 [Anthostomella pinea]